MSSLNIPESFPLLKLVAQELTQVSIGVHHVRLNFYNPDESVTGKWKPGAAIDFEAGFELREEGAAIQSALNKNLRSKAGCLTILLGQSIVSVKKLAKNELLLVFSNGVSIQLLTDSIGFESYHLHVDEQSVDVVVSEEV